jgi:hypothetical protein
MDVPISLAILLAVGTSLYETMMSGEHAYFDAAMMLCFFLLGGAVPRPSHPGLGAVGGAGTGGARSAARAARSTPRGAKRPSRLQTCGSGTSCA